MVVVITVGDAEITRLSSEDGTPVALVHLLWCRLIDIVACGSLRIAVGGIVMLILETCEEVVFAKSDVEFISDDSILRLGEGAVCEDITCQRP